MLFASFRFLLCCLKYLEVFRMRSCPSKSSEVSCAASASLAWRGIAQIWPSPSSIWMGITSWAAMSSENYTHFCWDICQPWRILRRNGDRLVQPNPLTSPGAAGEFADQRSYIRWLQSSENPVIRQQAPECQAHSAEPKATIPTSPTSSGSLGGLGIELTQTRPRWNQRFNCGVNPGHVNDSRPAGLREYFSRQQSMPELKRFWEAHYGSTFKRHLEADEIWWTTNIKQTSTKIKQLWICWHHMDGSILDQCIMVCYIF